VWTEAKTTGNLQVETTVCTMNVSLKPSKTFIVNEERSNKGNIMNFI
jgi:hypothetical protein